jgi:hypothetical protein
MYSPELHERRLGIRSTVRKRARDHCEICGQQFSTKKNNKNASMHHRHMRRHRGVDAITNLIHICNPCHKRIHRNEEAERYAASKGWICWVDSAITPLWLHSTRWVVLNERGEYDWIDELDALAIMSEWVAFEPEAIKLPGVLADVVSVA